jgi:hypothetical protein
MGYFGIIMVCISALAEHCDVVTSPYVFSTIEECQADVLNEALKIKAKYSYATIKPNCVELKYNGEPA